MNDYGRHPLENGSLPNRDSETGIRYGIISLNDLNEWALESFEGVYAAFCPECSTEMDVDNLPDDGEPCPHCGETPEVSDDWYCDEPIAWTFEQDGYALQLTGNNEVWIFKSPHITIDWGHCSPCAPGAAYLSKNPVNTYGADEFYGDEFAYCLGEDWF